MASQEANRVKLDSGYIRKFFKDNGLSIRGMSREMGKKEAYLESRLYSRTMALSDFKLMCLMAGMKEEDKQAEPEKKVDVKGCIDENTELVISYIQELGKIQTELLRELKEMKKDQKEQLEAISGKMTDLVSFIKYGKRYDLKKNA